MGQTLYKGDYFSLLVGADGTEFVYTGDEVLVVPLTEEREVIMTLEPSTAFGDLT